MDLVADAAAAAAGHRSACVDLRLLAKRMGTSFQDLRELREECWEKGKLL